MPKEPSAKAEFQTFPPKQGRVSKCTPNSAPTQGRVLKLSSALQTLLQLRGEF